MAEVVSVSVPSDLYSRWKQSDRASDISPSALFQSALETELEYTNKLYKYWADRCLAAEKKLKLIQSMVSANDKEVKKFAWFENDD